MTEPTSTNTRDNEANKFKDNSLGETSVNTITEVTNNVPVLGGSIIYGIEFDAIGATFPNATTEIYTYYEGGLAGTIQATVTVIYTNASKDSVQSVVRT